MNLEKGKIPEGGKSEMESVLEQTKALQDQLAEMKKQQQPSSAATGQSSESKEMLQSVVDAFIKAGRKEDDFEAGINEENIPQDDWTDEPVHFYCPKTGYLIVDDVRKGQTVITPYKRKIFFQHLETRRQGNGKYAELAPIARYTSNSKKVTEWLRNHSLFGIIFHEAGASNGFERNIKALRASRIWAGVKSYDTTQLIAACKSHNIPFNENYEVMKSQLVDVILETENAAEKRATERRAEDTFKSSQLLGRSQ